MKREVQSNKRVFWGQILKGVLLATSISLVGILLFGLVILLFGVTDNIIMPVNQVIKVVSIFLGVFFALKKHSVKGYLKGLIIGLIYTVFAYVLFSALSGNFAFNWSLLNDVLFGALLGLLSGIIVANLRK